MAKKKYYKVIVLVPEIVQVVRKHVYVNIDSVIHHGQDVVSFCRGKDTYNYDSSFEYFIIEQKHGKIDDGGKGDKSTKKI